MDELLTLAELGARTIVNVLTKYNGNRGEAARELGISDRGLYGEIKNSRTISEAASKLGDGRCRSRRNGS